MGGDLLLNLNGEDHAVVEKLIGGGSVLVEALVNAEIEVIGGRIGMNRVGFDRDDISLAEIMGE